MKIAYLNIGKEWMEELLEFESKTFSSLTEAEELLTSHGKLKAQMSQAYEEVSEEGKKLLGVLQRPLISEGRESKARSRVSDYSEAASHVMDVILEMHEQNRQLTILWEKQRVRLSQRYKLCQFELESTQVLDWIENEGKPCLCKEVWFGNNAETSEQLLNDHEEFEKKFEESLHKGKALIESAVQLAESKECDPKEISDKASQLEAQVNSFEETVIRRKLILKMATNFFQCTDKLSSWVEKLKEELNLDDQSSLDSQSIDAILEKHGHQCDTTLDALLNTVREGEHLSRELFQESTNLSSRTSWIEQQADGNSPETTRLAVEGFLKDLNSSRQQLEKLWLGKQQKLDYWVKIKNFERDLNSLIKNIVGWIETWEAKPQANDKNKAQIMLQKFVTEHQEMERSIKTTSSNGEELLNVLKDCGVDVTVTNSKGDKVDSLFYMSDILKTLGERKEELLQARERLHRKLQHTVQLRRLEFDAKRVAGWIRHGENILHASLEPGSSLVEAEALMREYEQFQIAIEKTRTGVTEVREKTESLLAEGPVDSETITACAEGVEKKWERLMKMADQRRAVVFASYNFYKASEQVSKLLDKFSKDCKGDEDPCREYKDEEPSIKVDKIAKLITQYEKEKIAVENGCKEVRESSEKFLKLVLPQGDGKSTPVLDGNIGRLEILVNDLVEQSTSQEITVIKQLQLRKNVLEGCLEYAQFEKNVNEALTWIHDHGTDVQSELEPSNHESENADRSTPSTDRHNEFKEVFEEIREKVKVLLQEASTLITKTYFHSEGVKEWAQSIDRRYKDFACFMKKYRQSLEIKLGCSIPELEDESEWPSLSTLQAKANELSSVTRRDISNDSGIHEMTEEKRRSAKRIEFIMNELLQTERAYCKDLKCCIENFLYPMLDSSDVPDPLTGKHEIIFGNIEEIYEFHSTIFLQSLEKYEARPEDVGNCFVEWADKFQMYVDYCANKPESNALLIEHGENFFEDLQAKRNVGLSLAAYLIKPVQRITKYQLLLKELLSSCDDTQGTLQAGLDVMLSVPRQANDTMYLCMIEGFNEGALETLGKILLQDSFVILDPKNLRRKGKERHIFLFEQALLFSKERKDSYGKVRYMYKNKMKTSELGITEHLAEDPCKFAVWIGEPPFTEEKRIIKAESTEVKTMWVKELRELIQQFQFGILRARTSFYPTSPRKKKQNSNSVSLDTSSIASVDRNSADLDSSISSKTSITNTTEPTLDIYVATVDFKAVGPNEISLEKGQTVEVLSRPPGSRSWRVRRMGDVTQEGLVPHSVLKKSEDVTKTKLRQSVETLHSHSSEESMNTSDSASSSNYSSATGDAAAQRRSRSKSVNLGTLKMRTWSRATSRKMMMNMTAKSPVPNPALRATTISGGGSKKLQHLLGAPESDIDLLLRPNVDQRSATLGRAPKNTFNGQLSKKRASFGIEDAGFQDDDNLSDSGSDTNDTLPPGSTNRDAEAVALKKRSFVLKELIQTEQDYVLDLEAIVQVYVASLSKEGVPLELKGKEKQLFGNIQHIYEFHKNSFLKEIEKCENAPEKLASVFLKAEKKLEMYVTYCQLKPKSASLLHDHLETFFEDVKNKANLRLRLNDYLIKPVQRIMKYQLLLKDFVKYTSRAGLDTVELKKALTVMQDVPKRANDMMNVGMLEGFSGSLTSQGKLLLQESLFIANAKTRVRPQERRVFLFEQLLVFSEPFERKRDLTVYIYRHGIKMNTLGLTEIFDDDPCKWAVWSKNPDGSSEIYVLIARSPSVKKQWVAATRDILESQFSLAKAIPGDITDALIGLKDYESALEHPIDYQKKISNGESQRPLTPSKSSPVPPSTEEKPYDKTKRRQSESPNSGKISPSMQVLSKPMSSLKHVKLISLAAAKSLEDLTKAFPVQERFIVLENYQAQTSDEMTVYKNDVVFLVSRPKKNANFLHVRNFCRERSGLVPATILKRMSEETEGKRQKGGGL